MTAQAFLAADGGMAARIRSHPWEKSPIGVPDDWSPALRTATGLMLTTDHPACLFWGETLTCLYNDAYAPILAADRHPGALGKPASFAWSDVWAQVGQAVRDVARTGVGYSRNNHLIPIEKDNRLVDRWWTYSYSPIHCTQASSGVGGVFVLCADVSEGMQLRSEMRASETRLQVALDAAELGAWELDIATGRSDQRTKRHDQIFGYATRVEAWSASAFLNHVVADDLPIAEAAMARATETGQLRLTVRILRTDGAVRWISARGRAVTGDGGLPTRLVGTVQDVTEQVRLRDDLKGLLDERTAERDRLWALSEDFLVLSGPNGRLLRASPSFARLVGRSEDQLRRTTLADLLHTEDQDGARDLIDEMRRSGHSVRFEGRLRGRGGTDRNVAWTLSPEPGTGRMVGIGRDVTADRAAAAELARVQAQLHAAQRLETIGQLTGGVAHDFNNLLTPIIGGLDLLRRRIGEDARTRRLIDNAMASAERAKTLVSRLLSFARRQHLESRPVDIPSLVEDMRDLIDRSLGPTITVDVVAESGLPPAIVDPSQLELALLNLCVNARDAMPDGGRLTISVDRDGAFVRLRVIDTGNGMDESTLARAIEPFYSTKGVGRGTGLGLSMVDGLAAQSGGSLRLVSAPGAGTTATLLLPAGTAMVEPRMTVPEPSHSPPSRPTTVLLIDDEPMVRENTAEMLRDLGHTVFVAPDAESGLAILKTDAAAQRLIGLLVSDMLLPGQSGAAVIRQARVLRPHLPALLITGFAPNDGETTDPTVPRLAKPFRADAFAASIAALLAPSPA